MGIKENKEIVFHCFGLEPKDSIEGRVWMRRIINHEKVYLTRTESAFFYRENGRFSITPTRGEKATVLAWSREEEGDLVIDAYRVNFDQECGVVNWTGVLEREIEKRHESVMVICCKAEGWEEMWGEIKKEMFITE